MAFMAAMLTLALYELTARSRGRWLRGLAAFIGAQSALLLRVRTLGWVEGGGGRAVIALVATLVVPAFGAAGGPRSFLPLAVVSAALVGMLSLGGAVWLMPALLAALLAVLLTRTLATTLRVVVAFAVFLVVVAVPTIVVSPTFFERHVFKIDWRANLIKPLSAAQLAGIWLTGDFRFTPGRESVTYVLGAVVTLRYGGPDLHPGSGGAQFSMGPVVLSTTTADLPVRYVRPTDARTLCGKSLDWVEALGS